MSRPTTKLDYRTMIKNEFLRRKTINPHYSLRTYAKNLGLSPMHMSLLLQRKRGLSPDKATKAAAAMGYTGKGQQVFRALVSAQSAGALWKRRSAKMWLKRNQIELALQQSLYSKNERLRYHQSLHW